MVISVGTVIYKHRSQIITNAKTVVLYKALLDRQFMALGFGGLVNGRPSHCFPLNGNPRNPRCRGSEGVLQAYYDSLDAGK